MTVGRLALLFVLANYAAPPGELSVLRVHPREDADPRTEVTVTFDRPVAGGLDATVDAKRIFRIEPAVSGHVEWRDPITLRFRPDAPLTPGASYRVTISNDFVAMDGTRLKEPYTFGFRIAPPKVLAGEPITSYGATRFVVPRPKIRLLISAPADPRLVAQLTSIKLSAACGGARIPLQLLGMRRVLRSDQVFLYNSVRFDIAGDTVRDLRRIVELEPATPLPRGCAGQLNVPNSIQAGAGTTPWSFTTYGTFALISAGCAREKFCPTGPIKLVFSTPVSGGELLRRVRIAPAVPFDVGDTTDVNDVWYLEAELKPRQNYAVVVDAALTDMFGQKLGTQQVKAFMTTSHPPTVMYDFGRMLVERDGLRTLSAQIVNVDTLLVSTIAVPEAQEAAFLSQTWRWDQPWEAMRNLVTTRRVPLNSPLDVPFTTGVALPLHDARKGANGTLLAVRLKPSTAPRQEQGQIALLQVTDLAVHGKMALDGGMIWVTGVRDGKPRANAQVRLYDASGKAIANARTDAEGFARFENIRGLGISERCEECDGGFEGYVAATLNDDRGLTGFSAWDPELAAWHFGISSAWSLESRLAAAAAVFTERGIYRPGERVYAKAIVREGPLGALTVPRGDSLKWTFQDREGGVLKDTVMMLSAFGTADHSVVLAQEAPLGEYRVQLSLKRSGEWRELASAFYSVAEYRPPEFLVDVNAEPKPRFAGDSVPVSVSARYLFGAPMAGAQVHFVVSHRALFPWEADIPNTDGYEIGGYDWDEDWEEPQTIVDGESVDTLDARGMLDTKLVMPATRNGLGARTGVIAVVSDANRQTVTAGTSILVHPAAFYIGVKQRGDEYFWRAGTPVTLDVIAVQPTGERVSNIDVAATVVRREWHRVRRMRGGDVSEQGGWVTDTVASCRIRTTPEPVPCQFTPAEGGSYTVTFTARDQAQRIAKTTMNRWAAGKGFVPWRDDSELKVDIIADKARYSVGDTASLLIASPFTDVEAWLTVEREKILESRRIRLTGGATTIKLPITEALAPNAYVGIVIVRGRSAAPGPLDDPGRPALRVGYVQLRVLPAVKQLAVTVAPQQSEYRPGDSARVNISVKNGKGGGERAEVTLWAVDEGVLALTGYRTPDPVALLYQERPLGVRLSSNLTNVAKQIPEGMKGKRNPGGSGGGDIAGVLRSRFQTTAFFLGSVITDNEGNATASAKLPDNLTTFRVMAVAVTAGDRYGSGQSSMLVTRPLLARPALPRFVRAGDRFAAGVVVNQRAGGKRKVEVQAQATGIALEGSRKKSETLNGTQGREVRFNFKAQPVDTAGFQFSVRGGGDADAVALKIPVRASYHPLAQTIAGAVQTSDTAVFTLEQDVDPARSRLEISFGSSTLAIVRGVRNSLRVYPYFCTEQVSSNALPLIALYRAQQQLGITLPDAQNAESDVRAAIRIITRRQRPDGGIGYWTSNDWSTPWLTAYAARVLIEARAAGFAVDSAVTNRIADYLTRAIHEQDGPRFAISRWYGDVAMGLSDKVMAVDLLSRLGKPDVAMENTLLTQLNQLFWEDRLVLAETMARRGELVAARNIVAAAWRSVQVEGRKLTLPENRTHYFESSARPAARLLTATLLLDPGNAQIGPLVETLVEHGRRMAPNVWWNTQDYGSTVLALLAFERTRDQSGQGSIRIAGQKGTLLSRNLGAREARDTSFALTGLVSGNTVRLNVTATNTTAPVYYYLTVREVPRVRPVKPVDRGISVERWYERIDNQQPITRVNAGELVRVRLRITVPNDREFVVLDDPLPAGLEAVDLSLRTVAPPSVADIMPDRFSERERQDAEDGISWYYGSWDSGVWSPFDYKELRDDRVVYFSTYLFKGTYSATYVARATTAGTFVVPPAHAEEMYNPAVNGRTGGLDFVVDAVK